MFFVSSFPQYDVEYVTKQLATFEMKGIISRISKGVLMRDFVQALLSIGENNITADNEKQIFGTLTDVRGEANSESGTFYGVPLITKTVLYLPASQEIMQGEFDNNSNQYIWKPTGEKCFASPDYDKGIFLGYQFSSVKSWRW